MLMLYLELREKLLKKEYFERIIGQQETKEQVCSALLSGRHIIISGPPGVGKTTIAKSIAQLLPPKKAKECGYNNTGEKMISGEERFIRVQGSPDLTAEDLIGDIEPMKALQFGTTSVEAFSPGKIFMAHNGVLFFDEINRAPERLQNALLQGLEEGEVSIGSYKVNVPTDFILVATLNPNDTNTEKLSSVFLDRFDIITMSYPETAEQEKTILKEHAVSLAEITFPEELLDESISFIRDLRVHPKVEKAPSVRATIGLYERATATALLKGHKKVLPSDITAVLFSVLAHRIELKPSIKYAKSPEDFLKEEIQKKEAFSSEKAEHSGDAG